MPSLYRNALLLSAAFFLLGACSGESAVVVTERILDDKFLAYSSGNQPGVAVMLIHNGEVQLQMNYGLEHVERKTPITADTAFRLASVSKQFTAMAVLILQEEGALNLDDAVSMYVPQLAPYKDVTIRHLLLHTGGIPAYYNVIDTSLGMPTNTDAADLLGEMANPRFPAGERYEYSNAGYDMLGPVVEAASGISYAQFMRERIFDELGMNSSFVIDHPLPDIPHRAYGYDPDSNEFWLHDSNPLDAIIGSGGIYSTLNDLYKWDQTLYREGLVSRESLEQMHTSGKSSDGRSLNYGLGWDIDRLSNRRRLYHTGSWVGFRVYIGRLPESNFTLVLLSNRSDFRARHHVDEITAAYLDSI